MSDEFTHRCTVAECCAFGEETSRGCACHRTREQMMLAALAEARAALRDALSEGEIIERCAKVAENSYVVPSQGLHPRYIEAANARAFQIAAAIRTQLNPESKDKGTDGLR